MLLKALAFLFLREVDLISKRQFNSYKSLFKINFKIYHVGDKALPAPIPLDALCMTVVLFFPLYPLGNFIRPENPIIITIVLAGVGTYLMSELDLQGKFMPLFLLDFTRFIFRHKKTNLYGRKITQNKKQKLHWQMGEVVDK